MKLETLKNLTCNHRKSREWCIGCHIKTRFKAEAIKWVKSKEIVFCNDAIGIDAGLIKGIQNAVIIHRNNITEEELE